MKNFSKIMKILHYIYRKNNTFLLFLFVLFFLLLNEIKSQNLSRVKMGSSPNLYTALISESNCLTANQFLNTIQFTKRRNASDSGEAGVVQLSISTNGGISFDSSLVVVPHDGIHFNRYPSGAIYNPNGNTNPQNAFSVISGPWHPGGNWQGNYFGSMKLSGNNNNVVYTDNNIILPADRSDFARVAIQSCDNGRVYVMGENYNDPNGTDFIAQHFNYGVLHIGTFNSVNNQFDWTQRNFPHPFYETGNFTNAVYYRPMFAFSQDGMVGYIIYFGRDNINPTQSYQPIVYKSTNFGITWNLLASSDFSNIPNINKYLRPTSSNNFRAFFTTDYGCDATVDANYNLHILSGIRSESSDSPDSAYYTHQKPVHILDVHTVANSNNWNAIYVGSLQSENDNSLWGQIQSSRIQISRSQDGQRVFYGWTDTDRSIHGSSITSNIYPDIYAKGLNVQTNLLTPSINFTSSDPNLSGKCYFSYFSNISLQLGNTYRLPFSRTYSRNETFNPDSPVQHEFIGGIQFTDNQFIFPTNPTCQTFTPSASALVNLLTMSLPGNNFIPHWFSFNYDNFSTVNSVQWQQNGIFPYQIIDAQGCIYSSNVPFNYVATSSLSISKTINSPTPIVGDNISFTIKISNVGPDAAVYTLNDSLPNGYVFLNADPLFNNGPFSWTGNINPGDTLSFVLSATVQATGNYTNTATVIGSNSLNGPQSASATPIINTNHVFDFLDTNTIKARFRNNFEFFWNSQNGTPSFESPQGSGNHAHFATALWVSGIDAGQNLSVAAQTYSQNGTDFQYGPISNSRTANNYENRYNRLWKVNKSQIINHISNFNNSSYQMPEVIANWPGNGIVQNGEPTQLAPYIDVNNNNIYDPQNGDYPAIKGDQAIYMIYNDNKIHGESQTLPLNIDIHVMAYEISSQNNALDSAVFLQYRVVNRGGNEYNNLRLGVWNDFDLGNSFDDVPGTDVNKRMAFMYNVDNFDSIYYGFNPPAIGSIFLNKNMNNCIAFNNDNSILGNPTTGIHFFNYMQSKWKDGTTLTYGGNGYGGNSPTSYFAPWTTDPGNPSNWVITAANDYRLLQSTEILPTNPCDDIYLETAFLFQSSTISNIQSAMDLKSRAAFIQNYYNNNLNFNYQNLVSPSITINTSNTTICSGQEVSFSSIVLLGGDNPVYQWKKNGIAVGTNSSTYSTNLLQNGDVISCTLISNAQCVNLNTVNSNFINISVIQNALPSINISANITTLCNGGVVNFSATTLNGGGSPVFQWKLNGQNVGTNSPNYSNGLLSVGDVISCMLTSSEACLTVSSVNSNFITMTLNAVAPSLTITASQNNVCFGTQISFIASSTDGGTNPVFQWKVNGINVGSNSSIFSSNSLNNNDVVSCQLTSNSSCVSISTASSNSINMEIQQNVIPSIVISTANSSICSGNNITFSSISLNGGSSPVYQWRVNGVSIGTNSPTFASNSLSNGDIINCILTSNESCITTNTVLSNSITISIVSSAAPIVLISATQNNVCQGTPITFIASTQNEGTNPLFQWLVNGNSVLTGGNSFTSSSLNNNDVVSCILISSEQCPVPTSILSNSISANIIYPSSNVNFETSNGNISEAPYIVYFQNNTGNAQDYTFTWYFGDGTTSNLVSPSHQYVSNGSYNVSLVAINNQTGCASYLFRSGVVNISNIQNTDCNFSVNLNLSGAYSACMGGSVTLVATTTAINPSFQWTRDGINIGGATQINYTATIAGSYSVIVYSNGLCANSSPQVSFSFLNNSPAPPTVDVTGNLEACNQGTVVLTASSQNAQGYLWSNGATGSSISVSSSGYYFVTCFFGLGCQSTSVPVMLNAGLSINPGICMVTVDTLSNKNLIIWEPSPNTLNVDSFYVYAETNQPNVYSKIGAVDYNDLSEYTDFNSNVFDRDYKYKITVLDTCGGLTTLSNFHKTINLKVFPGIGNNRQLSWTHYLGNEISNYEIRRKLGFGNFELIASVPSNINVYTDNDPVSANGIYRVDFVLPDNNFCNSTYFTRDNNLLERKRSSSNTAQNQQILIPVGLDENHFNSKMISIVPNPNNGNFYIKSSDNKPVSLGSIEVNDFSGRVCFRSNYDGEEAIDIKGLANGVYHVRYISNFGTKTLKMIVVNNHKN
jgi:uncharacterized repeat protein (TIGR01451 family)